MKLLNSNPCIMISPGALSLLGYKGNVGIAAGSPASCSLFQSFWALCRLVTFASQFHQEFLKISFNKVLHWFSIRSVSNKDLPLWKKKKNPAPFCTIFFSNVRISDCFLQNSLFMTSVGKPLCFSAALIYIHAEYTKMFFENKGTNKTNIFIIH